MLRPLVVLEVVVMVSATTVATTVRSFGCASAVVFIGFSFGFFLR
jgi:hypothetical protein